MRIRQAEKRDAPRICEIYNDAVVNSTAIWNEIEVDVANREAWIEARLADGFPLFVAVDDTDRVLGYATYGAWRPHDGYRHTVEHSVYVHKEARGQGLGYQLMDILISEAKKQGLHIMVAAIEGQNTPSIQLHEKLGFAKTGYLPEVGTKFGRWLDLALMQLTLTNRDPN